MSHATARLDSDSRFQPDSPALEWLAQITAHIVDNGLADASLRRLARVAGTSHAHLRYYFGSHAGLLGAVLRALRERESAQLVADAPNRRQALLNVWDYFTSDRHQLEMQLFFQVAGAAVQQPAAHARFVDAVVSGWVGPLTAAGRQEGLSERVAEQEAGVALAALRGLLLERLLTGDQEATDRAWARLLTLLEDAHQEDRHVQPTS